MYARARRDEPLLFQFAWCPRESDWVQKLALMVRKEYWGHDNQYLFYYCLNNFEVSHSQDLVYKDPDGRFALWRVGYLVRDDGTPMYMHFSKNNLEERQPYKLEDIIAARHLVIRYRERGRPGFEEITVLDPPASPNYDIPEYHSNYSVEYNWDHYLHEHRSRLERKLNHIPEDRIKYLCVFGSVELAHRTGSMDAVPQFYRGRYQYVLPLYITHNDISKAPDYVMALDEDTARHVYVARTLLEPEMAYANARSVATSTAQFRSWIESPL